MLRSLLDRSASRPLNRVRSRTLIAEPERWQLGYWGRDSKGYHGNGQQRGRTISLPERIVLVEGISADGLMAAISRHLPATRLAALGAKREPETGLYQLEYSIQNLV